MDIPKKEESALDSIENELYDPRKKTEDLMLHSVRDKRTVELPSSWGTDTPIIRKAEDGAGLSFGTKILLVSFFVLLISLGFTAWRVLSSRNVISSANIDMPAPEIVPFIEGGEATPLTVNIHNRNAAQLQEATLTLMYKKGLGSQDEQEKVNESRDIGTINADESKKQDFQVTLYGSESESRDISVELKYKVAGSNAIFSKTATVSVTLKTPPISVHVDGPSLLSVGQEGTYTISVKNNAGTTSLSSVLQLTLPTTFTISSTDPTPSARGQMWAISPLKQGETKTIMISGSLSGTQGETTTMRAVIGAQGDSLNSVGVVYSSQTFDIQLRTSPLALSVTLDTERGVAETLRYGDKTTLTIIYTNNSDKSLQNVSLKLQIAGEAPLFKQINGDKGYYDSNAKTIAWEGTTVNDLVTLAPHAQGALRVTIPIVSKGVNSPALKITITGEGTAQLKDDVVATLSKTWAVQGSANISAQTTYKNSPFKNSGPIPPQPNTDTTYTARFVVSAQNALMNTKVSFILPIYVTWKNVTSDSSNISFDSKTRTVTWNIGNIEEGKNVTANVGLSVRPSQSHVGQTPPITSGIVMDTDEQESKAHIHTTISALTTSIFGESWPTDPSFVVDR